jgi:hypothetical protein
MNDTMNDETMKHVGDAAAVFVTIGAFTSLLPPIASFLTIVWMAIRIFETRTFQHMLKRWRD